MANYTPVYPSDVIKQITIGSDTYALKDDILRAIIAGMNSDITENTLLTAISDASADSGKLVTNGGVKSYIDAAIQTIHNFDVVVYDDISDLPAASADTMYKLALVGGQSPQAGSYIEYITLRQGVDPSYTYTWEQIGSTEISLDGVLYQTATVAGVSFGTASAISTADLSTALDLNTFAHQSTASGEVAAAVISDATATINVVAEGAVAVVSATASEADALQLTGTVSKPNVSVSASSAAFTQVSTVGSSAVWEARVSGETLSFTWTTNELPTLTAAVDVLTSVSAELDATPTFTGDYVKATFSGSAVSASTTIDAFTVPSQTVTVS